MSCGFQYALCLGSATHSRNSSTASSRKTPLTISTVDPPSTFWAALVIWPPTGFSRKDRNALEKIGFYSRISRSLKRRGFRWKRTKRATTHKQGDGLRQAEAQADLALWRLGRP